MSTLTATQLNDLADAIKRWGREAGFQQIAITDTELGEHAGHLREWLAQGYHGEMAYMAAHGSRRWRPGELEPGTLRVISARIDYLPPGDDPDAILADPERGFVSRYALGRDYHKLMRKRLAQLGERINRELAPHRYRAFVDSAPVLERGLAQKAGLGWIGKNTMLINRRAGSWFFLGEIYTDLPLPLDAPYTEEHCGRCRACLDICPTGAIVAPYQVDARRCISYLTIELRGSIPEALRPLLGNRIYGCDDCQLVCPWNRFAQPTAEADFAPRHGLDGAQLVALFGWSEAEFLQRTEGSPIRRIGYARWLRNIAVALGNAPFSGAIVAALEARLGETNEMVREHVAWALRRQAEKRPVAVG
jgi:epoxyqueuosine reductase